MADLTTTLNYHAGRSMPQRTLNGLVLAGGRSTRMGMDKGMLKYHGKPQREFLIDLLAGLCNRVYTSCRRDQDIPDLYNPLVDRFEISGPMNGIMSAFANKHTSWLVVAVDMPFVDKQTLQRLIDERDPGKIATCYYNRETAQPEPLLTLFERRAYRHLCDFTSKGNASPREFLGTYPVNFIEPTDNKSLLNINSPENLLFWR